MLDACALLGVMNGAGLWRHLPCVVYPHISYFLIRNSRPAKIIRFNFTYQCGDMLLFRSS